jgi:tetraacyldisaccharide 4'-kinase
MVAFEDHHNFTENEINDIKLKYKDYSFITTEKDYVKLQNFVFDNIYLAKLDLEIISKDKLSLINKYIKINKI